METMSRCCYLCFFPQLFLPQVETCSILEIDVSNTEKKERYLMQQYTHVHPLAMVCVAAPLDAVLLGQWENHLRPLEQAGLITVWSERHLVPGADRVQAFQYQLDTADIVLLLLSADFFNAPDCLVMMERAIERSRTDAIQVIPVLLRPVAWQESPLARFVPWPSNGVPVTQWGNQDAAWDACVQRLRRLLGRQVSLARSSERSQKHADRDWERMLRRLRRSYKELLDQSLHGMAWVEPGLSTKPEAVSNVTNLLFRLPHGKERLLAPGTSVLDAYDEAEEELLILGAPGAGKSTLLLDLAQQLVDRAIADPGHPLPVILRLSSWAVRRSSLEDWMVEQFSSTYDVPRILSERWVKLGLLLPLLDGLDEMEEAARPACIAVINRYHRTHVTPLVVCSRQVEYEGAAQKERLALQSAVIVQPLSDQQIEAYLQNIDSSFGGIRAVLHQQKALWELASTPLMLSILLLTYRDTSTQDITSSATDLERQVWTDYVKRMVQEKGNVTRYPFQRTLSWLTFLAQQLQMHQQSIFFAEYLDTDWLPDDQQRSATWLTIRLPALLIGGCASLMASIFLAGGQVAYNWIFLLQMAVLGAFVGDCLRPSVVAKPVPLPKDLQTSSTRRLRAAILLGILLAASSGLSFVLRDGSFIRPYTLSNWLADGGILGLGSMLSAWAFQKCLDRPLPQNRPMAQTRLHLRGPLAIWMNTLASLHLWRAVATLGIGIGLSYGLSQQVSVVLWDGLKVGLLYYAEGGDISVWLNDGLEFGLSAAVTVILVRLILDASLKTLHFAERLRWAWHNLFRPEHLRGTVVVAVMVFLFYGLTYGFASGIGEGLSYGLGGPLSVMLSYGLHGALIDGLISDGLSYGLSYGLMYWLVVGLYQSMQQEHLDDQNRSQFNQGILSSLSNGFIISSISSIIILAIVGLSQWLSEGLSEGLSQGLDFGVFYGPSGGFSEVLNWGLNYWLGLGRIIQDAAMVIMWALSGGFTILRHYVIRWLLARHRTFPFRAQAFLDDATNRILLRRVGGGYSFIHRRLQDYLADATLPPSQN